MDEGSDHDAPGHARPARHHRIALPLARRDHADAGAAPDPAPAAAPHARSPARRGLTSVDFDPVEAARGLAQLGGLEAMRLMIAGELPPPPIATLLGFDLVHVEEGR